jgi:archaellum component FlaG (FlaF/FlaG flagellin family)
LNIIIKPSYCDIFIEPCTENTLWIARDTGFAYICENGEFFHVGKELYFCDSLPPFNQARPEYLYIDVINWTLYCFTGTRYVPILYRPDNESIIADENRLLKALQLIKRPSCEGTTSLLDNNGLEMESTVGNQQSIFKTNSCNTQPPLSIEVKNIVGNYSTRLQFHRFTDTNVPKVYYLKNTGSQYPPTIGDELVTFRDLADNGIWIDAPHDGRVFGRQDGGWTPVSPVYEHIGNAPFIDWALGLAQNIIDDVPSGKTIDFDTRCIPTRHVINNPNDFEVYNSFGTITFRWADSNPDRPHRYIIGYNVSGTDFIFGAWDVLWNSTNTDPTKPWVYTLIDEIWNKEKGWLKSSITIPQGISLLDRISPELILEYWAMTATIRGGLVVETVETLYKMYVETRQALVGVNSNLTLLKDMICKLTGVYNPCQVLDAGAGDRECCEYATWGKIFGNIEDQNDLMNLFQDHLWYIAWGQIKGDILNQTDLIEYIDAQETSWGEIVGDIYEQQDLIDLIQQCYCSWGDITGDILNQVDLITYIDNKLTEIDCISEWGDITGDILNQIDLIEYIDGKISQIDVTVNWGDIIGDIYNQNDLIELITEIVLSYQAKSYRTVICGNNIDNIFKIEHNLESQELFVQVFLEGDILTTVNTSWLPVNDNSINLTFAVIPKIGECFIVRVLETISGVAGGGGGLGIWGQITGNILNQTDLIEYINEFCTSNCGGKAFRIVICGDDTDNEFTINHSLNTQELAIQVFLDGDILTPINSIWKPLNNNQIRLILPNILKSDDCIIVRIVDSIYGESGTTICGWGNITGDILDQTDLIEYINEFCTNNCAGRVYRHIFCGNGSTTEFEIVHNLDSQELFVQVFLDGDILTPIHTFWKPLNNNKIVISFTNAPSSSTCYIVRVVETICGSSVSGEGVWGQILGNIQDQKDLIELLDKQISNSGLRVFRETFTGNNIKTEFEINHNLNDTEVQVLVWRNNDPLSPILIQHKPTTNNKVTLYFLNPPSNTDTYIVKVIKYGDTEYKPPEPPDPNSSVVFYGITDQEIPTINDIINGSLIHSIRSLHENQTHYLNGWGYALFAFPKSWGVLRNIKDENGFEMIHGITRRELTFNIDNIDIDYYVYVQNNKAYFDQFTYTFLW